MTPKQRVLFFRDLWPAACRKQGWGTGDDTKRHEVIATCMQLIGGPATGSTGDLGSDTVTALFCYMEFLASETLEASERWVDCQQDYHAFNRARQTDWHERSMYGTRANKLDRQRFAGATSAAGDAADAFDPKAIAKRHLTMASRHQAKIRKNAATATAEAHDVEHALALDDNENPFRSWPPSKTFFRSRRPRRPRRLRLKT